MVQGGTSNAAFLSWKNLGGWFPGVRAEDSWLVSLTPALVIGRPETIVVVSVSDGAKIMQSPGSASKHEIGKKASRHYAGPRHGKMCDNAKELNIRPVSRQELDKAKELNIRPVSRQELHNTNELSFLREPGKTLDNLPGLKNRGQDSIPSSTF